MRDLIARGFKDLLYHKKVASNTTILFASQILVLVIGLGIKTIQVRALNTYEYGVLALFGSITAFLVLFFNYASFDSLKVILANNDDNEKEREYFGIGIIIAAILGFFFSLLLFFISYFIDDIFASIEHTLEIGRLIRLLAPFCIILPFQYFISEIAVGSEKLKSLAAFHLFSRTLFVFSLFTIWQLGIADIYNIIILNLISWFAAVVFVLISFKPIFKNIKENYLVIKEKDKTFGLHCYFGAIVNQSAYKLDELFITYFVSITQLGFYTLASIICSPMTFLSRSFISSILKKLALKDKIPIRVFIYNTLWLSFCVFCLFIFKDLIVKILFGEEYMIVSDYIFPLSIAFFLQGMYAPFGFLTIKSKGKELRNVAYIEAMVSVIGNILLVPSLGVMGAIIASILARFTHLIGLLFYYLKMIRPEIFKSSDR